MYTDVFEPAFLKATKDYYQKESSEKMQEYDVRFFSLSALSDFVHSLGSNNRFHSTSFMLMHAIRKKMSEFITIW